MGQTKPGARYQSVSLAVPFIEKIKKHIQDKPEYRSIADFVREATREKMNEGEITFLGPRITESRWYRERKRKKVLKSMTKEEALEALEAFEEEVTSLNETYKELIKELKKKE